MRLIETIRLKNPGLAKASERSPLKAIRLFCLECMGGSQADVRQCTTEVCPLHPFRMGHRRSGGAVSESGIDAAENFEGEDGPENLGPESAASELEAEHG